MLLLKERIWEENTLRVVSLEDVTSVCNEKKKKKKKKKKKHNDTNRPGGLNQRIF